MEIKINPHGGKVTITVPQQGTKFSDEITFIQDGPGEVFLQEAPIVLAKTNSDGVLEIIKE